MAEPETLATIVCAFAGRPSISSVPSWAMSTCALGYSSGGFVPRTRTWRTSRFQLSRFVPRK
jgi:hypothetical protein